MLLWAGSQFEPASYSLRVDILYDFGGSEVVTRYADRRGKPLADVRRVGIFNLSRARYQILFGWALAIGMPALLSWMLFGISIYARTQYITVIGATLSLVVGVFAFRRLHIFPGIAAGGYVVMSISTTFSILAISLILLRLDYSRILLSVIYLLSVVFFASIYVLVDRRRIYVMGFIPGGRADALPRLSHVEWYNIAIADEITTTLDGVVADLHFGHDDVWDSRITELVLRGTPVYDVKQAIEQLTGRVEVEQLSENTLGSLNPNDVYLQVKAVLDFAIALIALSLLSVMMLVIGILVRFDSRGPALFKQRRTGYRAKTFVAYKFRTMRIPEFASGSAEEARQRAMTRINDPRITRFGGFLRRTRLDELPQLFNVLKGEMSLIGPRPEAEELTKWYEEEIAFYHYRHIIKPGLTGWAQVNQGHVTFVDQIREKLHLDFYYVKNFSFWLDVLIVIRTLQTMITGRGSR